MSGMVRAMANRLAGSSLLVAACAVPLVALLWAAPLAAQSSPAIENRADAAWQDANGNAGIAQGRSTILIGGRTGSIQLHKTVSRAHANPGDTLVYTIRWTNPGSDAVDNVAIADSLPGSLTFVRAVAPAGVTHTVSGSLITFTTSSVAPAAADSARIIAVVNTVANVANVASASWTTAGGSGHTATDPVPTTVEAREMRIELQAMVNRPLQLGDTLPFLIRLINPTVATPIRDVVLTDSLPAELEFLRALPSPAATGLAAVLASSQGTNLTWHFDVLPAGDTIDVVVYTIVRALGSGQLVNRVSATGSGIASAVAASASVLTRATGLSIHRAATALEIGTGEAVGYTITVENTGDVPLEDVVVHDVTQAGFTLQRNTVAGGELLSAESRRLRFAVGSLAPGATATISFVATLDGARGRVIENSAWAVSGAAVSDTAGIAVRLRAAALATQLVMGRVWLDDNGDGRQQPEERPLAHAVVWLSSGQTVRADTLGRFTLPQVENGRHALRVDPLSIPDGYIAAAPVSIRVDGFTTPVVGFGIRRDPAAVIAAAADTASSGFMLGALNVPRPRFAAPARDAVIASNRLFLRVEGEPSANVTLFDNEREVQTAVLRADGSHDFIGVEVAPGPHVFDAVIDGVGGAQRISVNVHVSGAVTRIERADSTPLRAGTTQRIALRVLDEWGLPVAQQPLLTVAGTNIRITEPDADASSLGHQLPVGANGALLIPVVADSAGAATLVVSYGHVRVPVALEFLPQIRSLVVLGSGEVGIGAAPDAVGSVVARGAYDERTSITLSYDSRRGRDDAFGGAIDPLAEARQPVTGDASEHSAIGSTTTPLSLRVEQDRNWLLLGDVDTRAFGGERSPGAYRRALPGVSGRWTDGMLDVSGFGALVSQQIVQKQIPGNGTSGPYYLGGAVRLGTERLVVETRDRLNASLVISRQELERFVDYDIDATTGTVLLRRALLSQDASGNPLVLVVLAEQLQGEQAMVAGGHAAITLTPFTNAADSVGVGIGYIEDESTLGAHRIFTGHMGATTDWGGTNLEFARVAHPDSAGIAYRGVAWLGSHTGTGAVLEWNQIDEGFFNPANPSLIGGSGDLRVAGNLLVDERWKASGTLSRQWFRTQGAERDRAALGIERMMGRRTLGLELGVQDEQIAHDSVRAEMTSATSRLTLKQGNDALWLEALQPLRSRGAFERPATYGIGASYRVWKNVGVQAAHRLIRTDSSLENMTTLGLRSEFGTGTRVWSEYQLLENVSGRTSAGLLGIGQRVRLTSAWNIDAQFERRANLSALPVTDPLRAAPLTRSTEAYWAASAGTEWTPSSSLRASLRAELSDGEERGRGYRVLGSAEAALNASWTLLARQDSREQHRTVIDGLIRTAAARSILAAAFRPALSSEWNSLFKLEYRSDENPLRSGGTVLSGTDRRVIGAVETIWTPTTRSELGARFALRHAQLGGALGGGADVTANTQFVGLRARRDLNDRFDVRANLRMMAEAESGMFRYDLAPALGISLIEGLDLEAGYRFGELRDADFSQNGGRGLYLSLGMSFTEQTGRVLADFWRARLEGAR